MRNAIHSFHIDHILPLNEGGETSLANLALSCGGFNSYKTNKTLGQDAVTKEEVSIYNPGKEEWSEHFSWSDDFLKVIGLTKKGRATVDILRLDRPVLLNMRRLTKMIGEHPPLNQ